MDSISVCMITKNEEKNLPRTLASVSWCDEIIVVDDFSTDRTVPVARKHGAKVIRRKFTSFSDQKNFAVKKARSEWILMLDADEAVDDTLASSIKHVLSGDPDGKDGYVLCIRSSFLCRYIDNCGWKIQQRRLFRRGTVIYEGELHETMRHTGSSGVVSGALLHHSYPDVDSVLRKTMMYSSLAARGKFKGRVRVTKWRLIKFSLIEPMKLFIRFYIERRGYRAGWEGFVLSAYMSMLEFFTQVRRLLLEMGRDADAGILPKR